MEKKYILTGASAEMKLRRMAFEIIENNRGVEKIFLAGILENGMTLAKLIQKELNNFSNLKTDLIEIHLNKKNPVQCHVPDAQVLKNEVVIVIDDVINSGKTFLHALVPLLNFQPKNIQTLTLVERSHKTFPVHADYVGISLATTLEDHISVEVQDGKIMGAYLDSIH